MSLDEPVCTVEEPDIDMASGSSYEISPHRTYVHSLDDSDEEPPEESYAYYELNPYVMEKLGQAARPKKESVPKWLATVQDEAIKEDPSRIQSLVPWRPPAWQQALEQQKAPAPRDDEDMMES
ncbi:hypothetical protein MOBT1_002915 [Malassezia obtusa]|uniref:Uncharacterized protein n=1 Tax=Malassezia obtusa TaxID=76774 RepID=A0AAF0E384_9BASI|nr:hypothetical protein MOBT1_002915 [Malassezia obtusa]